MKIIGPNPMSRGVGKAKKTAAGGGADFARSLSSSEVADTPAQVAGAAGLGSIDALLALQGDSEGWTTDRDETNRGHALLDELEAIRRGLLLGRIPRRSLEALADMLKCQSSFAVSPQLRGIMDEIDLRVRVELAKLSTASGGS